MIVRDVEDETLVYDSERHRAHSLNRTATFVWRRANGRRSPAEIARLLAAECGTDDAAPLVEAALERLARAGLLANGSDWRSSHGGISRREAARRIGAAAAVLLPVVVSISAPASIEAASCIPSGESCGPICSERNGYPYFKCPYCCNHLCWYYKRCV